MKETPIICPNCGELLIVAPIQEDRSLIPRHEDMIEPGRNCALSNAVLHGGVLLS